MCNFDEHEEDELYLIDAVVAHIAAVPLPMIPSRTISMRDSNYSPPCALYAELSKGAFIFISA